MDDLVATVVEVGERIHIKHVDGPVDVQSRNQATVTLPQCTHCRNARIYSLGWQAKVFFKEGIGYTYPWIEAQAKAARGRELERSKH